MPTNHPNVIIIMTDEQKATALPMYGNAVVRTPHLAQLAAEGARFEWAFATCPLCVPARVSLMTGRFPHTTGSRTNLFLMRPGERHLLDIMREHGYRTGLAGKNHCFQPEELAKFDFLREAGHLGPLDPGDAASAAARQWVIDSQVFAKAWGAERNPHPSEALGTAWITDRALEFIAENQAQPFFLWYSIADPHTPLQTASPYAEMYAPNDIPLPPQLKNEIAAKPPAQQLDYRVFAGDKVTPEIMRRALAIYYGMNSYIDDQVGRFLARLDELGLAQDTIIVYLSDHGDYMGEHGMIRKSKALYDCLCRIPLFIRWPGRVQPAVYDDFVCIEDLLPTLLDLLGWETPAGIQGRSFAPRLLGGEYLSREAIFGEHGLEGEPYPADTPLQTPVGPLTPDFHHGNKLGTRGRIKSVRTRDWKLVHYPGQPYGELYDLRADPWEMRNLYGQPQHQAVIDQLRARLIDWLIESEDTLPPAPPGDMGG